MTNVTPFAPIGGGKPPQQPKSWVPIMPVPVGAPAPPTKHPTLGTPAMSWTYRSSDGVLGYVLRFNVPTAEDPAAKEFRPLVFARHPNGVLTEWRWQGFGEPRPLYNLDKITLRSSAPILVCEGEKSADAAEKLAPGYVTTTTPGGAKSAGKADWRPVQGRRVIVWPDADVAGLEYANEVVKKAIAAGALAVSIVSPPPNCVVGFDAADALEDGFDEAQATRLLDGAKPADDIKTTTEESFGHRRRTPQRDLVIGLTELCEFWHDKLGEPYVTFPVNRHREHWRLRSSAFRSWLSDRFFVEKSGEALSAQALEDGLRIFEAKAGRGPEYTPYIRVGVYRDRLYYDLVDDEWQVIECTRNKGWSIIDRPPIKFLRSKAMRRQVEPEAGGMIEELRGFLNVTQADFTLVIGWLVAALRDKGPFPILLAHGEHGAGKSHFCRLLRSLIDPSAAPIRSIPKDDQNFAISASNSWLMSFDNLSALPSWFADGLCRIASGDGLAIKKLYTDNEEMIFEAQRPIMANGIPLLAERADLGDRALVVRLQTIPANERLPERELYARWEKAKARILGALFDAVCCALRNLDDVRLTEYPRMADFLQFVAAASPALGLDDDEFAAAYRQNQAEVTEYAFEADSVAMAVRKFITTHQPGGWEGTPQELLEQELVKVTTEAQRNAKSWPRSASALGNRIDRIAPLLRSQGIILERRRSRGARLLVIVSAEPRALSNLHTTSQ
jgi:putative DNA primase/helicase